MTDPALVEYGTQKERSHYRAHVSVANEGIIMFATVDGVDAILSGKYIERTASQEGVSGITSRGYAVPWRDIHAVHLIRIADEIEQFRNLRGRNEKEFSPSQKGSIAVAIVKEVFLRKGLQDVEDIVERQQQIDGGDLIVRRHIIIQVKMDWRCGPGPRGTGNVYLQTAERNPLKRY